MARADRLERLDNQRLMLEADYRAALLAALRTTAAGQWGLFGHTDDKTARAAVAPVIAELVELGDMIDGMRDQLSLEPFALHQAFLDSRGPVKSSAVGEPKQARAWLARLEAEAG
jgi:hypothetical protein